MHSLVGNLALGLERDSYARNGIPNSHWCDQMSVIIGCVLDATGRLWVQANVIICARRVWRTVKRCKCVLTSCLWTKDCVAKCVWRWVLDAAGGLERLYETKCVVVHVPGGLCSVCVVCEHPLSLLALWYVIIAMWKLVVTRGGGGVGRRRRGVWGTMGSGNMGGFCSPIRYWMRREGRETKVV
jgi:hypothetical protein